MRLRRRLLKSQSLTMLLGRLMKKKKQSESNLNEAGPLLNAAFKVQSIKLIMSDERNRMFQLWIL